MLATQKRYVEFLQFARKGIESTSVATAPMMDSIQGSLLEKIESCVTDIEQLRLLVPVTGAFSAGKSSLLNMLIGAPLLPVAITPETALATELHFDTQQRIEAVTHSGMIECFDLSDFRLVTGRAEEFEYLRVFFSSPMLEKIQPLILVDMPGFDSPLDTHNKAIRNFIDRGAHYVVLASVEEGGLTSQVLRRLQDILDNGRSFSLCLSKADLRPNSQVQEITGHIHDQLAANLNITQKVVVLDQSNANEKLNALINDIVLEQLAHNLLINKVKDVFFRLDADTSTVLTTIGKDVQQLQEIRTELRHAITRMEAEKERQLSKCLDSNDGTRHVEIVLNSVRQRLDDSTEQLVQCALVSQDALSQQINHVVQGSLVGALRKAHGELTEEAVRDFSRSIDSLQVGFSLPADILTNLIDRIKDPLTTAILTKTGHGSSPKGGSGGLASLGATGGLVAIAAGLAPWAVVAIAIVPSLVDWLVDSLKQNRQREQIITALRSQAYPDVMRQLRPQVESFLHGVMENAIAALAKEYEEHLNHQQKILSDAEQNQDIEKIEAQKKLIQEMQSEIRKKAEAIIFAA